MTLLKFSTHTYTHKLCPGSPSYDTAVICWIVLRNTWKLVVDSYPDPDRDVHTVSGRTETSSLYPKGWFFFSDLEDQCQEDCSVLVVVSNIWRWSTKNCLVTWCKSVRTYCTFQKRMCLCTCDACSVQISSFVSQMLVDHVRLINWCLKLALWIVSLSLLRSLLFWIVSWD